jgi:hypothetical protein
MKGNEQQNLMLCVRITISNINTQHPNGPSAMANHGVKTTTKFLEDGVICRYVVLEFVHTNNGREWVAEFDVMFKYYGIQHQHTTP